MKHSCVIFVLQLTLLSAFDRLLSNLTYLSVGENNISFLPKEVGKLCVITMLPNQPYELRTQFGPSTKIRCRTSYSQLSFEPFCITAYQYPYV